MLAKEPDIVSKIFVNKRLVDPVVILLTLLATNASAAKAQCPADFYQVPLASSASYCQLFADVLPASMSYYSGMSQQDSKSFYLNTLGQPDQESVERGRVVLHYKQGQQTIIISADKQGSQIDILVK